MTDNKAAEENAHEEKKYTLAEWQALATKQMNVFGSAQIFSKRQTHIFLRMFLITNSVILAWGVRTKSHGVNEWPA